MIRHKTFPGKGKRWTTAIACCILLLSGCVAQKRMVDPYASRQQREKAAMGVDGPLPAEKSQVQEDVAPVMEVKDVLLPTLTLINDRIYAYEQKLEKLKTIQAETASLSTAQETLNTLSDCRVQLQDVLVEYNALHQRLLQKDELAAAELLAGESLLRISEKDIAYLEGQCSELMAGEAIIPSSGTPIMTRSLYAQELLLKKAYTDGEYGEVISLYETLPLEAGQVPSFDTTFAYGQSLLKTLREAEARRVFADLLTSIRTNDQAQWEFRLMQLLADLEFGLELYDGARSKYTEINTVYEALARKNDWAQQQLQALERNVYQQEEVAAYAMLLKSHLGYNPDRDGYGVVQQAQRYIEKYPYSPVASNVDVLLEAAKAQADTWLATVLSRIEQLSEEKKFQEALLLVERVPQDVLPPEQQEMLRRKSEQLLTAESISLETDRLVQEQELQEDWNNGMLLLEAREYDQAIEVFSSLLATSYGPKAQERIDEAARLAAGEDRQRAAELFMRATRTGDIESKTKLLFASRKLLQDILIKYPQAGLNAKVNRNLERIEEEIQRIDPTLLTAPATVGDTP